MIKPTPKIGRSDLKLPRSGSDFLSIWRDLLEAAIPKEATILEIGIGPGYLARYLLDRFPNIKYIGLDFSKPMLDIAGGRLNEFQDRLQLIQADLTQDGFADLLPDSLQGVVTTWALHDLGSPEHTRFVYQQISKVLEGICINGDFIKPKDINMEFEAGRFEVDLHLKMLKDLNYDETTCSAKYEIELRAPTAAQNYAMIVGYNR